MSVRVVAVKVGDKVLVPGNALARAATVHAVKGGEALVKLDPYRVDIGDGKTKEEAPPSPWRTHAIADLTPA